MGYGQFAHLSRTVVQSTSSLPKRTFFTFAVDDMRKECVDIEILTVVF